ncbi:class I SAM-dependent methyltransferase [Mycolicibacterium sp. HS_4_1]
MSTFSETQPVEPSAEPLVPVMPLTGERTVPDLAEENYWFRRHEVVYRRLAERCRDRDVLEAGAGEGYGADLIADVARRVIGLDYDESAVAHIRARYPRVEMLHGNLAALPLPDASIDVVVNFQVIEHLWDQGQFVAECLRVLRPGGLLLMSTPNRITFTPGSDTPLNPFHTRELNAAEMTELLTEQGFVMEAMLGVYHGATLRELDSRYGGSIIQAQIDRAVADAPWPADLLADVAAVTIDDFDLLDAAAAGTDIDDSLDLVAIAVRP